MNNFSLDFYNPDIKVLILLFIIAIVLFISFRKTRDRKGATIIFFIRTVILLLSFMLILQPTLNWKKEYTQKPIVELWIDNTKSIEKNNNVTLKSYQNTITEIENLLRSENIETRIKFIGAEPKEKMNYLSIDLSGSATDLSKLFQPDDINAAVLISDGQVNAGISPYAMKFLNAYPVYTLGVGDTTEKRDARVVSFNVPNIVKLDEKFTITAELNLPKSDDEYIISLLRNDLEVDKQKIRSTNSNFLKSIDFQQIAKEVGESEYAIKIENQNDINTMNNEKLALQKVLPKNKNVLIVCGAPSFETRALMQILKNATEFNPSIAYLKNGKWLPTQGIKNKKFDFIIYVDYPEKAINEQENLLDKYSEIPALFFLDKYSDIGRINQQSNQPIIDQYKFKPSTFEVMEYSSSSSYPILRDINEKVDWGTLPPIKSDFVRLNLNHEFQTLLQQDGKNPIPVFSIGKKIAILVGNDFWRWKNMTDAHNYSQLIINTIKYLTEKGEQSNVQISSQKKIFLQGESAELSGTVYDLNGKNIPTADVKVEVRKDSIMVDDFYLSWQDTKFLGQYTFTEHGNYQIIIDAYKKNNKIGSKEINVKVENRELEYLETGLNKQVMRFIAKENNGQYHNLNEYEKLSGTFNKKNITKSRSYSIEFNKNIFVFLFIIFLFVSEWALRKYYGFL